MNLHKIANVARFCDSLLEKIAIILAIILILFGGYSLWDNYRISHEAGNEEYLPFRPDIENPKTYTLSELKKLNKDVCAWLTVKKTNIDYPVVRGNDTLEYINKNVKGEFSYSGSIFMDSRNSMELEDGYIILYGHNMAEGKMFGDVEKFLSSKYLKSHKKGYLFGEGFVREISFFAATRVNGGDPIVYNVNKWKSGNRTELLKYIERKSVSKNKNTMPKENDEIIALSTCTEEGSNGRIILFGILEKKSNGRKLSKKTIEK